MSDNERMTIEELIEDLRIERHFRIQSNKLGEGDFGFEDIIKFIMIHKPALERGMQKPLKFKQTELHGYELLDTADGNMFYGMPFLNRELTKGMCEIFAKSLGLPCEFIEDTP